jgi:Chaperone of endosialidase
MKTSIPPVLITFALVWVALLQNAQAVVPAPDGGYPGFTTAEGTKALQSLTTGSANTAVGWFSLFSNAGGSFNTAAGAGTLLFNTADNNTATGTVALLSNTTGVANTANGAFALFNNTTGAGNTGSGYQALFSNQAGANNAAYGYTALYNNTDSFNSAFGSQTLVFNTAGQNNTAVGYQALVLNTTGDANTATGVQALFHNTTGLSNVAVGYGALFNNTGDANTALGTSAGLNATTGAGNVYIGANMVGVAGESGACYIASIFGQTSASGIPVLIGSDNRLGTSTSSKRFKEQIKPMDKSSEAVLALKPVTFRYKKELDSDGIPQFGLVAEDVEKVNPNLVVRDKEGKPYTVRYEAVNAMLLNEFLKEHRHVQEQDATITQLKKDFGATIAQLTARLDEQASQIQKVSAQLAAASPSRGGLESSKFAAGRIRGGGPAPQVVNNP